jgi:hypothetical protein
MYLSAIRIQGLRGAEEFTATNLDTRVMLPEGPSGVAVADGLLLFAAALDRARCRAFLGNLGFADSEDALEVIEDSGFPTQISGIAGHAVAALLPPDGRRQVAIALDLVLDPPLYGQLRQEAVRDPRLVAALGSGARATIKVGWLFTNDLATASASVLAVSFGEASFPGTGAERPAWLGRLLAEVGRRFSRVGTDEPPHSVAARWFDRALSPDSAARARVRRAAEVLAAAPFALGNLEFVRVGQGVEARFGAELSRARQFGPSAAEAMRLVDGAIVDAPDVLVVEAPGIAQRSPEAVVAWLEAQATGADATLEQVIVVPGGPRASGSGA